jgi:hypothetical protein
MANTADAAVRLCSQLYECAVGLKLLAALQRSQMQKDASCCMLIFGAAWALVALAAMPGNLQCRLFIERCVQKLLDRGSGLLTVLLTAA